MENGPDPEFWKVAKPEREPSQSRSFLLGVVLAIIVSTPWYLPAELASTPRLGLPVWVWCTLLGALMLASCTSWAAVRSWRDSETSTKPDPPESLGS